MNEVKKPQTLLTTLKEKQDKYGNAYLIGDLGLTTVSIFKSKTKDGQWNVFVTTRDFKPREERVMEPKPHDDSDGFPF